MGESVTEATILRWLKKEGETVAAGDPVAELETDKVNVEVPADSAGVIQSFAHAEGDTVAVGDVLAIVGEAVRNGTTPVPPPPPQPPDPDPIATPLARKIAQENGVDLKMVTGTGEGGKVTHIDVENYIKQNTGGTTTGTGTGTTTGTGTGTTTGTGTGTTTQEPPPTPTRPEERVRMTRRRQTIATRLVEAQHTAAMLTTFNELDMTAVMAIRAKRKDTFKEKNGIGLGFMSFFTKASIGALKAFPLLNAEIQGQEIVKKGYYDIGIAVGAEEGLVVPVVRNADKLTFAGIEKEIAGLAGRAKNNTLTIEEMRGGTFTITNGGVFGSLMSTPILNAPQVAILGLHKIEPRPIALNGEVVIRPMMYVALSYDHRIVDGSEAVRFLVRIKELIEDPEALLLEG